MGSIYAAAASVLVLDSELMSLQTSDLSQTELFAHILASVWMCRSWTLQEGVLSTECAIQFQDKAVILSEYNLASEVSAPGVFDKYLLLNFLQLRSRQENGTFFSNTIRRLVPLWQVLTGRTLSDDGDGDVSPVTVDQFTRVWNALAGRSTTMTEDEYIILANVLDLPLLPLVTLATSRERMQTIILSLDRVPFSLFLNVYPGQCDENMSHLNSWVPSRVTSDILTAKSNAKVEPGYLKLENARLENDLELSIYQVAESIPHSSTYFLLVPNHPKDRRYKVEAAATTTHRVECDRCCSIILIVQDQQINDDYRMLGACFHISGSPKDEYSSGAGIRLVFCCSVRISRITANDTNHLEANSRDYVAQKLPKDSNIFIKYCTYWFHAMLWEILNDIIARPSSFKRLKKRRGDTFPLSHFVVSLGAALLTAVASLAAIDYGIIRRLLKSSVRSRGGIVLITITIFFLDVFVAAGLTLFFGGVWYLAYKHILVPLYHRNYIRSFEAHIRQIQAQ